MKTAVLLSFLTLLLAAFARGQDRSAINESIDFRPAGDFLRLPEAMKLGPCSGVDIDSRGNVYVIQRQTPPVLCFDSAGKFLRAWGAEFIGRSPDMQGPHGLRIDQDDFIWTVDR